MTQPISIQPLQPHHAASISEIHQSSQKGTFLTLLGREFLTVLYDQISQSGYSVSYAALYQDQVIGFIVGTFDTGYLFKNVIRKRLFRLGWLVLNQGLKHPPLFWQTFKTLAYPHQIPDTPKAELLALAVHPDWRNQQIGSRLLQQLIQDMKTAKVEKMVVTVDGHNDGALRFYQRFNFVYLADLKMYGRSMVHLTRTI